jgi:hypothetical protein
MINFIHDPSIRSTIYATPQYQTTLAHQQPNVYSVYNESSNQAMPMILTQQHQAGGTIRGYTATENKQIAMQPVFCSTP